MDYEDLKPAPGPLALVQGFVNTRNDLYGGDRLGDVERANTWLAERGLLAAKERVGEAERRRLVAFREELRGLLSAHNGEPGVNAGVLNGLVASAVLRVTFTSDGRLSLGPSAGGGPVDRVLGRLLAVMASAEAEGSWERLKACRNQECRWAFYDASKNRSGSWCDMQVCGARHKMRAYRRRKSESR
jgi:predicted RNA-binding Zn ribbon-like protein